MSLKNNLQRKNYNPCGAPTGSAQKICDAALTSYFNLPFAQVMRNVAIQEISQPVNLQNPAAIIDWANYNLNDIENSAALDFTNFSQLQIGAAKYFIHLLFENRYNIEYNRLVVYAQNLDDQIFDAAEKNGLTFDVLERQINSIAQDAGYAATFDDLTAEFENFIRSFSA